MSKYEMENCKTMNNKTMEFNSEMISDTAHPISVYKTQCIIIANRIF